MKNMASLTQEELLKEKISRPVCVLEEGQSLVFGGVANQTISLSDSELIINKYLDTLPSFILGDNRSPSWMPVAHNSIFAVFLFLAFIVNPLVLFTLLGSSNGATLPLVFGTVFLLMRGSVWFENWFGKKVKVSKNEQKRVTNRQTLLKQSLRYVSSPILQGRLAVLYSQAQNNNIDVKFWEGLQGTLFKFIEQERNREFIMADIELEKIRESYTKSLHLS